MSLILDALRRLRQPQPAVPRIRVNLIAPRPMRRPAPLPALPPMWPSPQTQPPPTPTTPAVATTPRPPNGKRALFVLFCIVVGSALAWVISFWAIPSINWWWIGKALMVLAGLSILTYGIVKAVKTKRWKPLIATAALVAVAVIVWYGYGWLTSRPAAPAVTVQPPTPVVTELKVRATREWSEPVQLPMGLKVDWMPNAPVEYQIMTADEKVVTFPAETNPTIVVKSSLYPWFKFRTVDANSVVISVTHYKP